MYDPNQTNELMKAASHKFKKMQHGCLISTNCNICTKYRGNNYTLAKTNHDKEKLKKCFLTTWGLSHILFNATMAFIFPMHLCELFAMGVIWEGFEHFIWDCMDPLDIVMNASGLILGRIARQCTIGC